MAKKKSGKTKPKVSDITFGNAVPKFLEALGTQGKNHRTIEVYGRCIENAVKFFGAEKPLGKLTPALVGQFYKSDELLKKPNGKEKSPITVEQGKRVLRLMLVWAVESGFISEVPIPTKPEVK